MMQNAPQLRRQTRSTRRDNYVYSSFAILLDQIMDRQCFLSYQLSAKAGLKMFGQKGAMAIMKELGQLILMDVIKGRLAHQMSCEQNQKALRYLMFLIEKRCRCIKGQGCADGRKQRIYKTKEETSSSTVSVDALFLSCIIDALQRHDTGTCNILVLSCRQTSTKSCTFCLTANLWIC
jgi:hypothetical protein